MDDARGNLSRGRRAWEGAAIPRRSVEESWRREAEYARFGRCSLRAARTGRVAREDRAGRDGVCVEWHVSRRACGDGPLTRDGQEERMGMTDTLAWQSIGALAERIRQDGLSPVALAEELLARIDALDPALHAFIAVTRERAIGQARAAEYALRSGHDLGPLHGIPYAAKDLYDVAGLPTTAGTRLLAGSCAAFDC